jgi:hypothetical protein
VFISTPRGNNHCKALYDYAKQSPDWFAQLLTAEDTKALSPAELANALEEYKALYGADAGRAMYEQEMLCSFNAAILGAFYAVEMAQVRNEGRILPIEADPEQYVHRAWDLGVGDDTSIWWFQNSGTQLLVLDHYAASGVGLEHYAGVIEQRARDHGWRNGTDFVPHDARVKEWGTGKTRVETMQTMGLNPLLVPWATVDDGINAARRTLPLCVFHPRCEDGGISALEQYRREWDDEKKAFRASALHDWASHPADAFRYLSMAWREAPRRDAIVAPPQGWHIPMPPEPRRRREMVL